MPRLLEGRHALVTGGGSGIGAAIAEALAGAGALLTLVGRSAPRLEREAALLPPSARVATVAADVTDEAQVAAGFAAARERHGPIAILVNNAGAAESAPLAKTEKALWDRMIAVNLTGAYLCCRAAVPAAASVRTENVPAQRVNRAASTRVRCASGLRREPSMPRGRPASPPDRPPSGAAHRCH